MKVSAIKCINCGDIIFSRARHDYHKCTCGNIAIDGGFDYIKIGFKSGMKSPEVFQFESKRSKKELYDDWNDMKDKYGIVKTRSK